MTQIFTDLIRPSLRAERSNPVWMPSPAGLLRRFAARNDTLTSYPLNPRNLDRHIWRNPRTFLFFLLKLLTVVRDRTDFSRDRFQPGHVRRLQLLFTVNRGGWPGGNTEKNVKLGEKGVSMLHFHQRGAVSPPSGH
ncbi:MAG: hypothetical protein LBT00_00420 [Spirochaetaceae bacterium]|nr:hypothetical protein [Spirochaetaceae bacterium]